MAGVKENKQYTFPSYEEWVTGISPVASQPDTREQMVSQVTDSNESSAPADKTDNAFKTNSTPQDVTDKKEAVEAARQRKSMPTQPTVEEKNDEESQPFQSVSLAPIEETSANEDNILSHVLDGIAGTPTGNEELDFSENQIGRYNWNLEHGLVIPAWARDWQSLAETESRIPVSRNKNLGGGIANSMSERVAQMRRNAIKSNWDKTWANIDAGHYDDNSDGSFNVKSAYGDLRRIAESYARAGGDPSELTGHGLNRGGFKARNTQAQKAAVEENAMYTIRKELRDDLKNHIFGTQEGKQKNDAAINRIQRVIGNAGGVQADADKVRVQYLYLPESRVKEFQDVFQNYVKALAQYARVASKDAIQINTNAMNQRIADAVEMYAKRRNPADKIAAMNVVLQSWQQAEKNLYSLPDGAAAIKEIYKAYVENIVRDADIDPIILDYNAAYAQRIARNQYKTIVNQLGGTTMQASPDLEGIPKQNADLQDYYSSPDRHSYIPTFPTPHIPQKYDTDATDDTRHGMR